ncbi:winged helix-turn-helix domain-containing protein [Arthrobacter sp. SLBN-112]|uniref:winged helix-turn-helix domain-containing protein n=1 Tax=Arthrobacter sp. SLBN-112 TaxID=2768452 RepID=UPI0027B0BDB2|nr:winged helix-turn-helix domain-containing protein [Arthrobacter sp. SLBN-112]MDQ0799506.1 DNA-binding GntR family transcriptional regulator [Arthrobacter sp. SLBN-112]
MTSAHAVVPLPLHGLERKNLREQALGALRAAITSGELPPGRPLVETELSDMLQISRGTLREAPRSLEQEGLITAEDHKADSRSAVLTPLRRAIFMLCVPRWNRWPFVHFANSRTVKWQ